MPQTVLITGATDGLGRALAGELAASGATVLVHGRDDARGHAVLEAIGGDARWLRADFASLEEVRSLAEEVLRGVGRLDVLVNNAGIGTTIDGEADRDESRDGYELRFAVNYLAGYLLTSLLVPLLERSGPARIVNVASAGQAAIDFDDVMLERDYSGGRAYSQSKLAQIMHAFDLAEELRDRRVTANALHPGTYMPTKMVRDAGIAPATPLEDGVAAVRRLVEDVDGVSGAYFNGTRPAEPHPQAHDPEARRRLRELSAELVSR